MSGSGDGLRALRAAEAEIIGGDAAQRAARAVIARWVAETARHRTRDRVRASIIAREAHDIGGIRRRGRTGYRPPGIDLKSSARASALGGAPTASGGCPGCCAEPIGVTTSCAGGW